MSSCPTISLSSFLDNYFAVRQISNKKYYGAYLITATWAYKKLFRSTIFSVQGKWMPVKSGEPYNYIEIPKGTVRWFSVATEDKCGLLQSLYYNPQINVIPKPAASNCSCKACDCGGCGDFENMTVATKLLFTINGVDYLERTWVKVCKNGDIIEYKEQPVKKYNDFFGSSGDYNEDYNEDFNTGAGGFDNYEIVTQVTQKTLCKIETRPCGCPEPTPENMKLIGDCCGCYLKPGSSYLKRCCDNFKENINDNGFGSIKVSECGNYIYFIPERCGPEAIINPTHLYISYQTNGEVPSGEIQVPEIAFDALSACTTYRVREANGKYGLGEVAEAERRMEKETNLLLVDLNLLSLRFLANLQDVRIVW